MPYLVDGSEHVRERGAIIAWLTDRFPGSRLGRLVGHPQRGTYLSWLFYYRGVIEPVALLHYLGIDHRPYRPRSATMTRWCGGPRRPRPATPSC